MERVRDDMCRSAVKALRPWCRCLSDIYRWVVRACAHLARVLSTGTSALSSRSPSEANLKYGETCPLRGRCPGLAMGWFGVMHALGGAIGSRVTVIPKCINTPPDIMGTKLFDLMMPLALKIAHGDGHVSGQERQCIGSYFVDQ